MALLHLLHDWSRQGGPALAVVTVDHGLRAEAAAEAEGVKAVCSALGIPHETLHWKAVPTGNLMDAAREARLALISDWARGCGIGTVALGHTQDDQAETFLMRLSRGSGVDGLSGMLPRRHSHGIDWVRPLLFARRAHLRSWLMRRGLTWVDDPTNEDASYLRVRVRQALPVLETLGIDVERILDTQMHLGFARRALEELAHRAARDIAAIEAGEVLFRREPWLLLPFETQLRLLSHAVAWVSGAPYRPRLAGLLEARGNITTGRRATLGGCLMRGDRRALRIGRELRACGPAVKPGAVWDGRFIVEGPDPEARVGALGPKGLALCANWRDSGLPRDCLLTSPGVWKSGQLIAAPLARTEAEWRAIPARDPLSFFSGIFAH